MRRLSDPVVVPGLTIMVVAPIGIGVNTGSALLFRKSAKVDLNAKAPICTGRQRSGIGRGGACCGRHPADRLGLA